MFLSARFDRADDDVESEHSVAAGDMDEDDEAMMEEDVVDDSVARFSAHTGMRGSTMSSRDVLGFACLDIYLLFATKQIPFKTVAILELSLVLPAWDIYLLLQINRCRLHGGDKPRGQQHGCIRRW